MNNAKDARGIDQFPYARSLFEDHFNPINVGGVKVPPSMFKPPVPKSLNMVRETPDFAAEFLTENLQKRIPEQKIDTIIKGGKANNDSASKINKSVLETANREKIPHPERAFDNPKVEYVDTQTISDLIPRGNMIKYNVGKFQREGGQYYDPMSTDIEEFAKSGNETLRESIYNEGFKEPIVIGVGKETGEVLLNEGHHRLHAALQMGISRVPVVVKIKGRLNLSEFQSPALINTKGLREYKDMSFSELDFESRLKRPKASSERGQDEFGNRTSNYYYMNEPFRQDMPRTDEINFPPMREGYYRKTKDFADGGEVMNGIGSLNETARNMSRGPLGIGAYQQFADGGELNVDLQPLDLPVDGRMSYTKTDDGGRFDSEIRKTFEGGLGSLTPSFDYSTQNSSRNMGDVVIDENGEQIGFAVEGELFLNSDPNSEDKVRGAFEVEKSRNNTNFTFPEGEFVRTDEGLFKRFNLGMDLGKFGLDLNRMEGSGRDPVNSGSATIRIGENGIVRYSDSDRGEPTIGFNYAKEFADGGPVYMAGGGSLSRYTELRDGNKQNTFTALQGVDAERLKRQRGYYERGPDALGSNVYTGDTGSRLLLPAEDRPIIEDIAPISDVDVRDLPPPVMPTPVMPTPVMPTPFVPPPVMPTYDGSTISPMVSTPTMPTYDGSFPVMDREPFVMDRVPREVMYREPFVMDRREVRPREVMDPLVMDPAPLQPQPIASPAPSALNIGAGMSANDLQRMLARRSVGPTNLNEVNSSILSLQQAEVANRARRANVPPQRPYEPPPTGPSSPYGTPLTGPSSPYGPGSPYGPPPTGPGSPYGPPPTGPGSPYGPYGREVQPYGREVQPTSYGIGSFGQPMQQQGFGSNKPTANVLF